MNCRDETYTAKGTAKLPNCYKGRSYSTSKRKPFCLCMLTLMSTSFPYKAFEEIGMYVQVS